MSYICIFVGNFFRFVANVGGILGLTMGCSLVTIFEVLHHVILIFLRTSARGVYRIHRTMKCYSPNKPQQRQVPNELNSLAVTLDSQSMIPQASTKKKRCSSFSIGLNKSKGKVLTKKRRGTSATAACMNGKNHSNKPMTNFAQQNEQQLQVQTICEHSC